MTNEIRDYAEQEADEVEVEEEHVHWAPWNSTGVNTSMNYDYPVPPKSKDPKDEHKANALPTPAKSGSR